MASGLYSTVNFKKYHYQEFSYILQILMNFKNNSNFPQFCFLRCCHYLHFLLNILPLFTVFTSVPSHTPLSSWKSSSFILPAFQLRGGFSLMFFDIILSIFSSFLSLQGWIAGLPAYSTPFSTFPRWFPGVSLQLSARSRPILSRSSNALNTNHIYLLFCGLL